VSGMPRKRDAWAPSPSSNQTWNRPWRTHDTREPVRERRRGQTADWKRLKHAGVDFLEDPTDCGNLWIGTLKDPEGHLVQLVQLS
jgi:hypothetical protein